MPSVLITSGTPITNKATILRLGAPETLMTHHHRDIDKALGVNKPPAVEVRKIQLLNLISVHLCGSLFCLQNPLVPMVFVCRQLLWPVCNTTVRLIHSFQCCSSLHRP